MGLVRAGAPDLAGIRKRVGVSLEEIARSTRISVFYLRAIENGDIEKLPGGIYTTSYIRQYARGIDYPEEDLIGRYGFIDLAGAGIEENRPTMFHLNRLLRFLNSLFRAHIAVTAEKRTG